MINKVQSSFSIQDLEILSGIKAHTIRTWEKRYVVFNPNRLGRNIRLYSLDDLKKILNISVLLKHGFKISELAKRTDEELCVQSRELSMESLPLNFYINSLLISMFSLDEELFEEIYTKQSKDQSLHEIYVSTFIPLFQRIGLMWQTKAIRPIHEHFISNLIYQKIAFKISSIPFIPNSSKTVNALFLPEGEMHEIGLMFLTYHLKLKGERTIYLGRDIPMEDLHHVNAQFPKINWICSFAIDRTKDEKTAFLSQIGQLLAHSHNSCWIIGANWESFSSEPYDHDLRFYADFGFLNC